MQSNSQQEGQDSPKSDVEFWQYVIESQKTSGLSIRQFCKMKDSQSQPFTLGEKSWPHQLPVPIKVSWLTVNSLKRLHLIFAVMSA